MDRPQEPPPEPPGVSAPEPAPKRRRGSAAAGMAVDRRPPLWYRLAWIGVLPLAALYLLWRSLKQREYRRHWAERFLGHAASTAVPAAARTAADGAAPVIWVHAVSVGETRAAEPLIGQLAQARPVARFVLTHMTPTGRAAGQDLLRRHPGRITQRYLPYDSEYAVARFLDEVRPQVGVLMETEIWPALLHALRRRRIPVVLASARLSQRSLDKALRHAALLRDAAAAITCVGAQSVGDARRIARLYDGPVVVTGNAKFDLQPDADLLARGRQWRARLDAGGDARPLWVFASSRAGEERLLLQALARGGGAAAAGARLLVVPRHPQRFDEVADLLHAQGAGVWRRAQWENALGESALGAGAAAPPGAVLLGDSMGEMALYYAMADIALIGGSLLPLGGQNLIEACACGCAVVFGPHMFNFAAAAQDAIAAGAALRARDADDAVQIMTALSADPARRAAMSTAARAFAAAHRGATARTVELILQALTPGPSPAVAGEGSFSPSPLGRGPG